MKAIITKYDVYDHYSVNEGLSEGTITFIYQDSEGFLWFGTEDGLNKFDGYSFTVFRNDPTNRLSIGNNIIHYISEDDNNQLWVVNELSIDLFNKSTNSFQRFNIEYDSLTNSSHFTDNESNIRIYSALQDRKGNFWLYDGLHNSLIYCNVYNKKVYRTINEISRDDIPLEEVSVKCMYEDSRGFFLFGTLERGVFIYDHNKDIFRNLNKNTGDQKGLTSNNISHITEDKAGNYWLSTYGGGVNIYNPETKDIKVISTKSSQIRLNSDFVFFCLLRKNGTVLVGTDGGGLNVINMSDSSVIYSVNDDTDEKSISNDVVRYIYDDRFGNIWIGNYKGGINVLKNKKGKNFNLIQHKPNKINSLSNNNVTSVMIDNRNQLWVGTDGGGLNVFNENKERIYPLNGKLKEINRVILSFFQDSKNRIWIGTYMNGVYKVDLKTKKVSHLTFSENDDLKLFYDDIRAIQEDLQGNIWFGTNGAGIIILNPENGVTVKYRQSGQSNSGKLAITNNWITNIDKDNKNNLWISTTWGLTRYDCYQQKLYCYFIDEVSRKMMLTNNILSVCRDKSNNIWVGTRDGLYKFGLLNDSLNLIRYYSVDDGLPNNVIHGIMEDSKGFLWLSTNHGISKFDPRNSTFRNYDKLDGLQGNDFNTGSYFKSAGGEFYFGGINGLSYFFPDKISDDTTKPTVLLTKLKLMNKEVSIGKERYGMVVLNKDISLTKEIILSHKEDIITIEFVGLHYSIPQKNKYAYKLENFDNEWHKVNSNIRFATYTNLDPGKYIFRVKASNCDNVWNEAGASLEIIIKPPFWDTWLFRIFCFFIILGILGLIYFFRVYAVQQRNIVLEKMVTERTKVIEEKNNILSKQTMDLNETNVMLEERQQRIEEQAEELKTQKEKLEEYNEELKEVNRTKDKFFSIIAHDLKNPFNVLLGFCELLQSKFDTWDDDKKRQIIDAIFESSVSIYALLNNLLQWSRAQRGAIKFMPVSIPVDKYIQSNIEIVKENAQKKKIDLITEITDGDTFLLIDINMANTVLRNLLTNAIKFTNEKGKVLIRNHHVGNFMEITVSDNGVGIDQKNISKLFTIGESITTPGTNKEKGTGLGLILCKEFVEKMGGEIRVKSELKKGSNFTIKLPLA